MSETLFARPEAVVESRQQVLAEALGVRDVVAALADALAAGDAAPFWLTLAVLHARLPLVPDVERVLRVARLDGSARMLDAELARLGAEVAASVHIRSVRVISGAVTVDMHHTASTAQTSGIQRVVRETVRRWSRDRPIHAVGWTEGYEAFRDLPEADLDGLLAEPPRAAEPVPYLTEAVIPWRGTHVIAELAAEPERTGPLLAMARFSGTRIGSIGYDCVPVTSAETVNAGMSTFYVRLLSVLRESHCVAAISEAAAGEFGGWRAMVQAAGFAGPEIVEVMLPVQAAEVSTEQLEATRAELCLPGMPTVLVVGSHEPRKNHLAVLHAAELLWREGLRFSLAFVGSGAWRTDEFHARVDGLRAAGRPLLVVSGVSDGLLWAGYRLARCVVFPSLNEGFGLPVAEALAVGTPVVTSGFGSMRQIVTPDGVPAGGVLVDPHDDGSIADALRSVLTDEVAYRRLRAEAAARSVSTWDHYADELWMHLV